MRKPGPDCFIGAMIPGNSRGAKREVTRTDPSQRATGGTRYQWKTTVFCGWQEPDKARGEIPRAYSAEAGRQVLLCRSTLLISLEIKL